MEIVMRFSSVLGLVLLALVGATPPALRAQQAAPAAQAVTPTAPDAQLTAFAKAFVEVGRVRDSFEAQLAMLKNKTLDHQAELRVQMREKVAEAIQRNGLTAEVYRRVEYSITVDDLRRAAFDQALTALDGAQG